MRPALQTRGLRICPKPPVAPVMTTTRLFIQHLDLLFRHALYDRAVGLFDQMRLAAEVDEMTGLGGFGFQVKAVVLVGFHDMGNALS